MLLLLLFLRPLLPAESRPGSGGSSAPSQHRRRRHRPSPRRPCAHPRARGGPARAPAACRSGRRSMGPRRGPGAAPRAWRKRCWCLRCRAAVVAVLEQRQRQRRRRQQQLGLAEARGPRTRGIAAAPAAAAADVVGCFLLFRRRRRLPERPWSPQGGLEFFFLKFRGRVRARRGSTKEKRKKALKRQSRRFRA